MRKERWFFAAAVAVQALVLAFAPLRHAQTLRSGAAITLATAPVDPYDAMRGYNVRLRYAIEDTMKQAAQAGGYRSGQTVYAVLRAPADAGGAWQFERLAERIEPHAASRVYLKGRYAAYGFVGFVDFGIDTYDIPEARRAEVNDALRKGGSLVDLRVASDGDPAIVRLRTKAGTFAF